MNPIIYLFTLMFIFNQSIKASSKAREMGIPFEGKPGPYNSITDVGSIKVGHTTLKDKIDGKYVNTGVTAIIPTFQTDKKGVFAGVFSLNGTGEMTGTHFIEEWGTFFGPLLLTGTTSVGVVRDSAIKWAVRNLKDEQSLFSRILPVVAETYDGALNDVWGSYVKPQHVFDAINNAKGGVTPEGGVGGGTGMVTYYFKAGIGTSSRIINLSNGKKYTLGVLVQSNFGRRDQLIIAGKQLGKKIKDSMPIMHENLGDGSIIVVIATDAPLLPYQLKRLARRSALGIARTGGVANTLSGELAIAFSTTNTVEISDASNRVYQSVPDSIIDPLLEAVVYATEESIINSMVAAKTTIGRKGKVFALTAETLNPYFKKEEN